MLIATALSACQEPPSDAKGQLAEGRPAPPEIAKRFEQLLKDANAPWIPLTSTALLPPGMPKQPTADRGWLGVRISPVTAERARHHGIASPGGALVDEVFDQSPAKRAGVQADDVIVSVAGVSVATTDELTAAISDRHPGQTISLGIRRSGTLIFLSVTVGSMPG